MTKSEQVLKFLQDNYGTKLPGQFQIQRYQFYDYARYPVAGTTSLRLFSVPLGGTDPVSGLSKTQEQTNLKRTGELEYPFVITNIRTHIHLLPKKRQAGAIVALPRYIAADIQPVMNSLYNLSGQGVLNISFGQKKYFDIQQQFRTAPPGFGIDILAIPASAAAGPAFPPSNLFVQQSQDNRDIWQVDPVLLVEKTQTLDIAIDFPNGTSTVIPQVAGANVAVDIGVWFDGYAIQPNQ